MRRLAQLALLAVILGGCRNTPVPPPAPTPTPSNGVHYVTLSWPASPDACVNAYTLYKNGALLAVEVGSARSYKDSVVTPNKTYTYYMTAACGALVSNQSNTASVTINPGAPPKSAAGQEVRILWAK